jgi:hypothetical protein
MLTGLKDARQFDCIYRPIDLSGKYFEQLLTLSKHLKKLASSADSGIIISADDIPRFHILSQKELAFFKLYTWSHSTYAYKGSFDDFMRDIDTPEMEIVNFISAEYTLKMPFNAAIRNSHQLLCQTVYRKQPERIGKGILQRNRKMA